MVFDKTGTLTAGRPALTDIRSVDGRNPDEALSIAASLEISSEHPLARALVRAAEEKGLAPLPVENFLALPGKGVSGKVLTEAGAVQAALGNAAFVLEHDAGRKGKAWAEDMDATLGECARSGKTPVVLLLDGAPSAIFSIADPMRKETPAVISSIRNMGITCIMLTGDNAVTAASVAKEAGIDEVIAGVLPEGKADVVKSLREKGDIVGMVGDGINDAPPMSVADVGFAMQNGIDVAVETGDVVLMRHGIATVGTALALGRAVMRNIRENLFWAFAYNIVGIPFAAGLFHIFGGPVLSPMLAGAAMAFSSVSVVGNALRLRFFSVQEGNQGVLSGN
jgi:Cu+-exporting ATPase